MKKIITLITVITFAISLSSCTTTDESGRPDAAKSAQSGAFMGALGGFLTGIIATGNVKGGLKYGAIGAAVGGLTGFIIGKSRERQYKTADQIYREKPQLANESARNQQPSIANMTPKILNGANQEIRVIKNGEWIVLGSRYQIDIPKYSRIKEVTVIESNTLISSNGLKMDSADLTREKVRTCGLHESGIEVHVPKDLPSGIYTHYASVVINNQKYEKVQKIQVVKVNGEINYLAFN